MRDTLNEAAHSLMPPESMLGTRRLVAWCILALCVITMRLAVRILPATSPVRIFVEGTTSMARGVLSPRRYLAAPAPDQSTLQGS